MDPETASQLRGIGLCPDCLHYQDEHGRDGCKSCTTCKTIIRDVMLRWLDGIGNPPESWAYMTPDERQALRAQLLTEKAKLG